MSTSPATSDSDHFLSAHLPAGISLPGLQLGISTRLILHRDFFTAPTSFAAKRGVSLVAAPIVDTTISTDPDTLEKVARRKANIHLVAYGALSLFADAAAPGDPMTVRTIEIDVALLLYGNASHPLAPEDTARALSRVQREVAPLLAAEEDVLHIIPGTCDGSQARASWRCITSTVLFLNTRLQDCYQIAHPGTGPAEGTTPKRIELGQKGDDLIVTFEAIKIPCLGVSTGVADAPGIRATVSLKGRSMINRYRSGGNTTQIGEYLRLTGFDSLSPARVHQEIMGELEGVYLPPPVRQSKGRAFTAAKGIVLMACVTPLSDEQILAKYVAFAKPSRSTLNRLKDDIRKARLLILPEKFSSRLTPAFQLRIGSFPVSSAATVALAPQIAAIYV